eukprot:1226901-Pyramimonas_sp.AAC.1
MASKTTLEHPRGPQTKPTAPDGPGGHQNGPRWLEDGPRRPKRPQRGLQDGPRGLQEFLQEARRCHNH